MVQVRILTNHCLTSNRDDMTIPTELKTTEIRESPAHGLEGSGFVRWGVSNILKIRRPVSRVVIAGKGRSGTG